MYIKWSIESRIKFVENDRLPSKTFVWLFEIICFVMTVSFLWHGQHAIKGHYFVDFFL